MKVYALTKLQKIIYGHGETWYVRALAQVGEYYDPDTFLPLFTTRAAAEEYNKKPGIAGGGFEVSELEVLGEPS